MWPQFGDDVLEETLSISEGARQSLNRKREGMSDWHKENLQHHGLAPREAPPPLEDPAPQEGTEMRLNDRGDEPPSFPGLQRGTGGPRGPYARTSLVDMNPDASMGPSNYNIGDEDMLTTQGSLGNPPDFPGSGAAPLRSRESFRTTQAGPGGFETQATPQFASDMRVDEINDANMATRVDKRLQDVKEERKVKIKTEPKLEPVKTEVKIKQEGVSHRGPGSAPSIAPDEEVQTVRVKFNNNEDMSYWEGASGNEMKAQLNLRFPQLSGNWQYKNRPQLISTIRGMIRQNQRVQGDSAEPSTERGRSRSPARPSAVERQQRQPAASAEPDDEVEVSGISWDQNTEASYWEEQSSNYIRQQLTKKYPDQRMTFAFLKERKDYINMITDFIKKGKYP